MKLTKPFLTFDPRSKLAMIVLASLLLMCRVGWEKETFFIVLMFVLLTLNGAFKKAFFFTLFYVILLLCDVFLLPEINGPITAFFSFFVVVTQLLIPPTMAVTFATNQTKMSEWIATMKKMHIPMFIIIPFSVVCRFFPVLIHDFKQIVKVMKFRGVGISSTDVLRHPFLTMEYIIIPILSSVEITAADLSAAALVRGLGNQEKHSSIYDSKLKIQDYFLMSLFVFFLCKGVLFP